MNPEQQPEPQQPRDDNLIPFPGASSPQMPTTGAGLEPAPEVLDGELVAEPEYARRPMPVVLPPWLRSRDTAVGTLRWAMEYAGRHVAFHAWRSPTYGLALAWWTLRGAARAITAGFGWISVRSEYRPLITAAREAKRWDLVRDLITERRALARVRMKTTAWLTLSGGSAGVTGLVMVGPVFGWSAVAGAGLGALWIGRPPPPRCCPRARYYRWPWSSRRTCSPTPSAPPDWQVQPPSSTQSTLGGSDFTMRPIYTRRFR
jgi:DNA segregation ATPase FtsK/SpoIIIE, S-DNA-T family